MVDNLKELGNILKERREKLNKTIADISKETRIKEKYLEAIENGDSSVFPADIYLIGYIKAYARAVGLSEDEIRIRWKDIFVESAAPKETILEKQAEEKKHPVIPLSFGAIIMIVAVVVILIGVIIFIKGKNIEPEAEREIVKVENLVDTTITKLQKYSGEGVSQIIFCKTGPINPEWAIARVESITLEIEAKEPINILVETDYKRAFKGTLNPNVRKSWRAKDAFYLMLGKPSSVRLWFNGFPLKEFLSSSPAEVYINRGNVLNFIETESTKTAQSKKIIPLKKQKLPTPTQENLTPPPQQEKPETSDSVQPNEDTIE